MSGLTHGFTGPTLHTISYIPIKQFTNTYISIQSFYLHYIQLHLSLGPIFSGYRFFGTHKNISVSLYQHYENCQSILTLFIMLLILYKDVHQGQVNVRLQRLFFGGNRFFITIKQNLTYSHNVQVLQIVKLQEVI